MESLEALRERLIGFVRWKFASRGGVYALAEDIVNQAFLEVGGSAGFSGGKCNFGYMSMACLRGAYKVFHRYDADRERMVCLADAMPLIDEDNFVDEVMHAADVEAVFASLQVLKEVERVIVRERYYGAFTFREISERHGIKLNTVLTHHRRALEKLRPLLLEWRPT